MKKSIVVSIVTMWVMMSMMLVTSGGVWAEDTYPNKPITLSVPYGAGGSTDLLARSIASVMTKYLGQPVVVENWAGGGGIPGVNKTLKAKPDGYTIGMSSTGPFCSTVHIQDVPYDPLNDVQYVLNLSVHPVVLIVRADSPWQTLEDFVADVKANPQKYILGQNSPGGTTHIAMASFMKAAGLKLKMVPYSNGAEEVAAILGGHVDCGPAHPTEVMEQVRAEKLRVLMAFQPERVSLFPDAPAAPELGYDIDVKVTKGIYVPKDVPADIAKVLHDGFKQALEDKDFLAVAAKIGEEPNLKYMTGEQLAQFQKDFYDTCREILQDLGMIKK